jgi:hypothetical protein
MESAGKNVPAHENIWRRLHSPSDVAPDGDGWRISSGAFRSRQPDGISVHRVALTSQETILSAYSGVGLAELSVADVEAIPPLEVHEDPIINEPGLVDDPSHALIVPIPKGSRPSQLAARSRLVRLPDSLAV